MARKTTKAVARQREHRAPNKRPQRTDAAPKRPTQRTPRQPAVTPPIVAVHHIAVPPGAIPIVHHDPVKGVVSVVHAKPDSPRMSWAKWFFG